MKRTVSILRHARTRCGHPIPTPPRCASGPWERMAVTSTAMTRKVRWRFSMHAFAKMTHASIRLAQEATMFSKLFAREPLAQSQSKGAGQHSARQATSIPSRATACRRPRGGPTCCSTGRSSDTRIPERRRGADRPPGRAGLRRQHGADRQRPPPHLQGTGRLEQPARPCAGGRLRRQAGQSRAAALGQQPGHGGRVAGRHQGRRGGRQHHATAARGRTRQDRRQGPGVTCAVRQPHCR